MGLILRSLVTCLFVTYAHGLEFRLSDGNDTCIIAKMDASFILSNGNETSKLTVPQLEPNKSACAHNGSTATLAFKWTDTNDTMTITFIKGIEKVDMNLVYSFIPANHFKAPKDFNLTVLDAPRKELSMSNMSYKCDMPEDITFKKIKPSEFQLVMSVANVQIQAFDVENGRFSDFEECSEDAVTTEHPTSEATTVKPHIMYTYKYSENNRTCIILKSAIQLHVNYIDAKKNPVTSTLNIPRPQGVQVTGHCVNDTGNEFILLNWKYKTSSSFSLKMNFTVDENTKLDAMEVRGVMSQADFPALPAKGINWTSSGSVDLFETSKRTYYKCNSLEEVILDNITTVVIEMIQVQAFGVENSNFTGTGTECSQDLSTEKPTTSQTHVTENTTVTMTTNNQTHVTENTTVTMTTSKQTTATSAPMTTTAPLHPTNNYSVTEDNITCVFLVAGMDITIPYVTKNGTNTSIVISVPQDFQTDGKCTKNRTTYPLTNELNIHFFNHSWILSFVFQSDNSSSQLGDMQFKTYSVKSITLVYDTNSTLFPDHQHQENGTTTRTASTNITAPLFQSKVNGSYKCNAESDVPLSGNLKLEIRNLQYKAFNMDNSTSFGGELSECAGDNSDNNKTNSIVPIAVGAALAGLVVIVLIAYLIGRRRNRKGYESV